MDEDEDWALAPTQVAQASQALGCDPPGSWQPRERCAVCALDVTRWGLLERTRHLNACLDAAALRRPLACPACARDLTDYSEQRRAAHANLCLDRLAGAAGAEEAKAEAAAGARGPVAAERAAQPRDAYACKICGQDLAGKRLDARIRHVKQCGAKFGVRPSDLAAVLAEEQAPISKLEAAQEPDAAVDAPLAGCSDDAGGAQKNAFALMMARAASGSPPEQARSGTMRSHSLPFLPRRGDLTCRSLCGQHQRLRRHDEELPDGSSAGCLEATASRRVAWQQ